MKRKHKSLFLFLLIFIMFLSSISFADKEDLNLVGEAVLLIDYDSNRILYEKNSDKRMFPASTTKIMTAILAIENGNMDDIVEIDPEIIELTKGSHIALDYDEKIKFEDLINGLMIASANDAALAIGKHVSGSIEGFVDLMNAKAEEIGALNTHFVNPNGLHDDNHYTTAYDLFLIAKYAMENESFRTYASKSQYIIPPTNKKTEERLLHTTNKFLYGNENMDFDGKVIPIKYEGIKGIKTGTTPEAKNCLVSYAERERKNIISVVLKSEGKQVYADTYKLLDYGFNNFDSIYLGHSNEFIQNIDIENGSLPYVSAVLNKDISYMLTKDEAERIEKTVEVDEEISLPLVKGDTLGNVVYTLDDNVIAKESIVSTIDVSLVSKNSILPFIFNKWFIILIGIIILLIVIRQMQITKKRKTRNRRRFSKYS